VDTFVVTLVVFIARYLEKLTVPIHLNFFFVPRYERTFFALTPALSLLAVLTLGALLVLLYRRNRQAFFFAAWVPLTLAPVLNVAAIGPSPFGEPYLYIPSPGFFLLLVWAARALVPDRRALIGVVAALLVLYSAQTMERNRDWVDTETIASRTLESSPEANWVRSFLSADYFERDK